MLASWWGGIAAYGQHLYLLVTGHASIYGIVAALGLVALAAGILLAWRQRVPQARRMIVVGVIASLAPIAVNVAGNVLGWVGMLFAVLAGFILMLVGTWIVANVADRRLPVWLLGLFATALMICASESVGAFVSLSV